MGTSNQCLRCGAGRLREWNELSDEERAAERGDRVALFVEPGEDLSAETQVRANRATGAEGDRRLIEEAAIAWTRDVVRLAACAQA